ncbi:PAS domain-containing sensor histidine kinase [Bacterioplanes sanyensis]|uniref:histidine kinase n=1 Tax=Bacterioplanes sanyensis TaxID=1249553 RepID=A0A222FPP7_9GAMM|nr:ATP-binding protein [Bacterioplanes sanyensis]ASP40995.1 PAS domain-containing sensor histidine kinase [Bacterioplanes sanyensis]
MGDAAIRQPNDTATQAPAPWDASTSLTQPADLKKAFHLFTEMSQQLTDSYAQLEHRVEQLSGELASVSAQRMQELAEKERLADRLESLLQLMPAGVLLLDENGYVTKANPAADGFLLRATGAKTLVGQRWRTLIQQCFSPKVDDGHEISLVDGRRVQLQTAAMVGEGGQLIVLTDMTQTRELQSRLSQHQRLSSMGKMVASLAHQIRTPLAAATLYAGHLAEPELHMDARQRFAAKLQERLQHLESQVRDMLIFARGEAPLNDDISLQQLLQELQAAMEIPLRQHHAELQVSIEQPRHRLRCNRDALVSCIMNLINNALEACQHACVLRLSLSASPRGSVDIRIQDNGPGIASDMLSRIKDPFVTTKSNGTGLGLAVVQAVVRAHRGEFLLTNNPAGPGTIAQILLPPLNHGAAAEA